MTGEEEMRSSRTFDLKYRFSELRRRFIMHNRPLTPSLERRGNACKSPLLSKEGTGEVVLDGYVIAILNSSTQLPFASFAPFCG
jgi:hypothetical protein